MFFNNRKQAVGWLVACLGNPGPKYAETRHNVGFMTARLLEKKNNLKLGRLRFRALTGMWELGGEKALIMMPQTYMNLSGEAVAPAAAFYKIQPERVLVVCDDTAIEQGTIRIKRKGSAGGHNGLKSIIQHLGTDEFPRVKIGVGAPPHPDYDLADWVLAVPRGKDSEDITAAVGQAARAVEDIISGGIDRAMGKYN